MGDKPSEPKTLLWTILTFLAGFLIGNYIIQWHVIRDHGFWAVRYDSFLVRAFGVISMSICFWYLRQPKEVTTLGIGEGTTKKLR